MSLLAELKARAKEINMIAAQHGASNLRVFGSVARGEETPDSDIDLVASVNRYRSYFDVIRLEIQLGSLLKRPVHVVTDGGMTEGLKKRILPDLKVIDEE